jgi:pre-rRNA-processing protein RIX1
MSKSVVSSNELSTLRALTFRLSSTPIAQLPKQIPAITTLLASCKSLLLSTQASGSKTSSEASVAVHRYRTAISTLLQDKTIQGRWAAIVLVKATIEIGGWETLQKSLQWVRHLLDFLSKPDPPSSKKLCIITLTRIFLLTRDYPTLVREITTPSLPTYIQKCVQIASSDLPASLLQTILESFNQLLPRHSTTFRSYLKQLSQLLSQILSATPSNKLSGEQRSASRLSVPSGVLHAARQLYVQLPCCAPKGASSEEWDTALKGVVTNAHRVANKVFRAVVEDWQSTQETNTIVNGHALDNEVQDLEKDSMDLSPWSGLYAGGERLVALLRLVKEYMSKPTPGPVTLPLGVVMDLATRMLSLTVPPSANPSSTRFNNQVSKEERDNLWTVLPQVHVSTIELLLAVMARCEETAVVLDAVILEQISWVFEAEQHDVHIRTACYGAVSQSILRSGLALPKSCIDSLATLLRVCCNDVLPLDSMAKQAPASSQANGTKQSQASTNTDKR